MSINMKNCFADHGAFFIKPVFFGDSKIADIRALRPLDKDMLQSYLGEISIINGEPVYRNIQPEHLRIARIVLSLGGELHGKKHRISSEGWVFDREINLKNVNLLDEDIIDCLDKAISELDKEYETNRDMLKKELVKAVRFLILNDNAESLLFEEPGTITFCRSCDNFDNCSKSMSYPRIPANIRRVIQYIFLKEKQIIFLPWGEMLMNQPIWFIELSLTGLKTIKELKDKSNNSG